MNPAQWNAWRVIPRILILAAYVFTGYAWLIVFTWFTTVDWETIDNEAVALAIAAFPAAILGVLTTNVGTLTNNYFKTGGANGNGNGG